MICKSCGGESRGNICTHCGAPLVSEAFQAPQVPVPASVQTGIRPARPPKTARGTSRAVRKAAFAMPRAKITLGAVLPAVLALLLPLAYLFLDLFVIYPAAFFAGDTAKFSLLMLRLADGALAQNPIGDIITATYGEVLPPISYSGAYAALSVPALRLPAAAILVAALLSALCAVLLLFTFGRVLRSRLLTDFIVCSAFLGAAAPFVAMLLSYLGSAQSFSAARVHFTVEVMLLATILLCFLPLAARRVYRVAWSETAYAPLPARMVGRVLGTRGVRFLCVLLALGGVCLPLLPVFISFGDNSALLTRFVAALSTLDADWRALLAGLVGGDPFAAIAAFARLGVLLFLPLLAICAIFAFFTLCRILTVTPRRVARKPRLRARLIGAGNALRRPLWLMLFGLLFCKLATMLVFFLGSAVKLRVVGIASEELLSLLYLLVLMAKVLFSVSPIGVILLLVAFLCTVASGGLSCAFVRLAEASYTSKS